ncbi:MAG: bifunctional adenosylcobinamide kinase/adenosylcobinamide-phosphate guanylyltransferase [Desulfamplus sp.]|nr:bifunctional adenosylcobinamide kinase/adenosylcobinamide-phosphate guanylyltransferase [Desulfamplus sp.]
MRNKITLVIGGCRSGKSNYALNLANQISGNSKVFMATSVPTDREMEERVTKHQIERGKDWITVEEPIEISEAIKNFDINNSSNDKNFIPADVILIDCLTLWVSNLMFNNFDDRKIATVIQELQYTLTSSSLPIFLVSNEVGMGIVPENGLARRFRDIAGMVNQKIAQTANQVIYMVAGIPMTIKSVD